MSPDAFIDLGNRLLTNYSTEECWDVGWLMLHAGAQFFHGCDLLGEHTELYKAWLLTKGAAARFPDDLSLETLEAEIACRVYRARAAYEESR